MINARLSRVLFAAAAVLLAGLVGVVNSLPAAAEPPSANLEGESLSSITAGNPCPGSAVPIPVPNGTYTFTAIGNATGPYAGTFNESGSYTVANGTVTAFDSSFTITSDDTVVEGSKTRDTAFAALPAVCRTPLFTQITVPQINVLYTATITNPDGTAVDSGTGSVGFQPTAPGSSQVIFIETFTDSQTFVVSPNEPQPTAIALSPDTATNPISTQHTVTATVTDDDGGSEGQTVTFTVTGASSESGTCTTDAQGRCDFTYTGPSAPGTDSIRGCVTISSGDLCDTVSKSWEPLGPSAIDLTPSEAVNDVATPHTVTATVTNASNGPVRSEPVSFSVAGSTNTSGTCTTDAEGTCTFTYTGPSLPGADTIEACVTTDAGQPLCDTATKAWQAPATMPGQVTGGGQIVGATFGFSAKSDANGVKGNCNVVDPGTDLQITCVDATTVTITGTHPTIFGNAMVSGASATYRIDVDDLGEPGRGRVTYRIQTSTGLALSGTLTQGNIQIHR
jgi:hypothetical protein